MNGGIGVQGPGNKSRRRSRCTATGLGPVGATHCVARCCRCGCRLTPTLTPQFSRRTNDSPLHVVLLVPCRSHSPFCAACRHEPRGSCWPPTSFNIAASRDCARDRRLPRGERACRARRATRPRRSRGARVAALVGATGPMRVTRKRVVAWPTELQRPARVWSSDW